VHPARPARHIRGDHIPQPLRTLTSRSFLQTW
jgi:hypothetical protein